MNKELPQEWRDTLALIQTKFPEAVIAGGALRDTILDRPVGDIDIFVKAKPGEETELALMQLFGIKNVQKVSQEWTKTYGEWLPELDSVWSIGKHDKNYHPFQIIALNIDVTPQSAVERFDFGICRVAYDGKNLYRSPAFDTDAKLHEFTVLRAHNKESTWKRLHRFTDPGSKYAGWKLRDPHELLDTRENHEAIEELFA